jgi:putative N6-adenine-specific DNA methylase
MSSSTATFDIFAVAPPGLEHFLLTEIRALKFASVTAIPGGISFKGNWSEVWRANLELRGATRILVRIGSFMAFHLAQLDKRATKFPWSDTLPEGSAIKVEVTCSRSKIYHDKAAAQRIENALQSCGYQINSKARISLKVRIDDNRVTLSLDSSGDSLHKRGHKEAVGKAPMRETLASLFLRQAGYDGAGSVLGPVLDPMCGSGTFLIEAAEMAHDLQPGRSRSFAFEHLNGFDPEAFATLRRPAQPLTGPARFFGSDRDPGAVRMSKDNAMRAGLGDLCDFRNHSLTEARPPQGPPGLVITNPPYGGRIGNKNMLHGLYAGLGETLRQNFSGWRVAIITSEPALAKSTGLVFTSKSAPVPHGGLKIRLFQTEPL